jgi:hypothetical protein
MDDKKFVSMGFLFAIVNTVLGLGAMYYYDQAASGILTAFMLFIVEGGFGLSTHRKSHLGQDAWNNYLMLILFLPLMVIIGVVLYPWLSDPNYYGG